MWLVDLFVLVCVLIVDGWLQMGYVCVLIGYDGVEMLVQKIVVEGFLVCVVEVIVKKVKKFVFIEYKLMLECGLNVDIVLFECQLGDLFGLKVVIMYKGGVGNVSVFYVMFDQFDMICQWFSGGLVQFYCCCVVVCVMFSIVVWVSILFVVFGILIVDLVFMFNWCVVVVDLGDQCCDLCLMVFILCLLLCGIGLL